MVGGEAGVFRKLFPQGKIPVVLSAVFEASDTLRKETDNDREDWITERLHAQLITIYPFRDGPLSIQLRPKIPSSYPDADKTGGEIDLLVPSVHGYEVYFAIEAKRLRFVRPNGRFETGNSEYVKKGMMRFITGKYAPFMKTGAMLGYVFDGETDKARSGIDNNVRDKAEVLRLKSPKRLVQSKILPNKPIDETHHNLKDRFFTIYHIFIAV